jgi:hypothetical protein
MPCRPKLCQRFAAQLSNTPPALPGNNHIWISDELLAEAFNRYVRVSHTAKRHGSNVPGPLEARRRATKRRMGMAVAGAAMGPPGGDFGALFGAGAGQPSIQNSWSWTAPGTQSSEPPAAAKKPVNIWSWSAKSPKQLSRYEKLLEIPKTGGHLVAASRNEFDRLLMKREKIGTLHKADVAAICDFLRSSADEPAAMNTAGFVKWLSDRSVSQAAWQDVTALICDKIQLDSIRHRELIQVVKALPVAFDWQHDQGACQQLRDIYAAFAASLPQDPRVVLLHQAIFEEICNITQSAQACSDLVDRLDVMVKLTGNVDKSSENISLTLTVILKYGGKGEPRAELLSRLASVLDETPTEVVTEVHQAVFEEFRKITQSTQACSVLVDRLVKLSKIITSSDTASENLSSTLAAILKYGGEGESRVELLSRLASVLDETPTEIATKVHQAIFEKFCKITQSTQSAPACSVLVDRLIKLSKITTCCDTAAQNISSTLLAISRYGGEDESRAELLSRLASALDEIPTEIVTEVLGLSTRFIVDKSRAGGFARAHALNWLKCLSAYQSLGRSPLAMKIVYAELAKALRPSQIAEHFQPPEVQPIDTIRLLLDTWLPNADLEKLQNNHERRSASSGRKERKTLQFGLRDLSVADLPAVADEFEQLQAAGNGNTSFTPWKNFLRAFARTGVEYEAIAHEVFDICKVKYPTAQSFWYFVTMLDNLELALPTSAAVSLIKHFLAAKRPDFAFSLFKSVPSVAITDVPELPAAYLEHRASTRGVFEILLRQPDTVPREWREVHKLMVTPKHIEVVHLVAYDIANAAALRPSQAYRSVWSCYRWLQDRGAPLQPLISRAFVTAGILRPLQELLWIPEQRLDYILSIVEKVEGPEDRDQVELLARGMRNSCHQGVLSKRRARRQNFWWEKGTRMQVEETRFRVKKWTKEKPLPTAGGTSYWVPMQEADSFSSQASSSSTTSSEDVAVQERYFDAASQWEPAEDVSTSENEVHELEGRWRPSGEEELESWSRRPNGEKQESLDIAPSDRSSQDLSLSLDPSAGGEDLVAATTDRPQEPSLLLDSSPQRSSEAGGGEDVGRESHVDPFSPQEEEGPAIEGVASVSSPLAAKMLKTYWRPDGEQEGSVVATTDRFKDISLFPDSPLRPPSETSSSSSPRGEDIAVRDRHVDTFSQVEPTQECVSVPKEAEAPKGRWPPSREDELL